MARRDGDTVCCGEEGRRKKQKGWLGQLGPCCFWLGTGLVYLVVAIDTPEKVPGVTPFFMALG